jgi:hypothetical protein
MSDLTEGQYARLVDAETYAVAHAVLWARTKAVSFKSFLAHLDNELEQRLRDKRK